MSSYHFEVLGQNKNHFENLLFTGRGGLYYCGLFLWIAVRILEQSMITVVIENSLTVFKGLELTALLIVLLHELSTLRDRRFPIITITTLLALFSVVTLISQRLYLLQLAILIIVGRDCDIKQILKCALYSTIITAILIVALSLLSFIPNYLFLWGGRERYGLGFKYATYLPALVFSCILLYGYINADRLGYLYLILCTVVEIILFVITDARFLCPLGILAAALFFFITRPRVNAMPILRYVPLLFMLFPLISYFIAIAYTSGNEVLYQLNSLLSSRLQLSHNAIETWGIGLLGADVEANAITWQDGIAMLPEEVNVVDSSYISSLINYGFIVTVILLAGYAFVAFRAWKSNDVALLAALLMISVMGLIEPRLLVLEYNPFILSLGTLFSKTPLGMTSALLASSASEHIPERKLITS